MREDDETVLVSGRSRCRARREVLHLLVGISREEAEQRLTPCLAQLPKFNPGAETRTLVEGFDIDDASRTREAPVRSDLEFEFDLLVGAEYTVRGERDSDPSEANIENLGFVMGTLVLVLFGEIEQRGAGIRGRLNTNALAPITSIGRTNVKPSEVAIRSIERGTHQRTVGCTSDASSNGYVGRDEFSALFVDLDEDG